MTILALTLAFAITALHLGTAEPAPANASPDAAAIPAAEAASPLVAETAKPAETVEQLKKAIIEKNIFRPARTLVSVPVKPLEETEQPPVFNAAPRTLKRPFKVLAFDRTEEGARVYLHFDNPSEDRMVKVGDVIEFVRILEITPPYIRCNYDGRDVRIDAGETSNDAYTRLMGLGSNYHLIGTTVRPEGSVARFYFPREGYYRTVEVGDVLGNAKVIAIERGRVHLRQEDGTEFNIKTTSFPQP